MIKKARLTGTFSSPVVKDDGRWRWMAIGKLKEETSRKQNQQYQPRFSGKQSRSDKEENNDK
jgi:hypothetical protein